MPACRRWEWVWQWPGFLQVSAQAVQPVACKHNYFFFFQDQEQRCSYASFFPKALAAKAPFTFCKSSSAGQSQWANRQKVFSKQVPIFPKIQAISVKPKCPSWVEEGLMLWSESALCNVTPRGKDRAMTVSYGLLKVAGNLWLCASFICCRAFAFWSIKIPR